VQTIKRIVCGVGLLAAFAGGCGVAQRLVLANATLVDVVSGKLEPHTTVVVEGRRIVRVIHGSKANVKDATVVDASGEYLIPGLWDMHTHVYFGRTAVDGSDFVLPMLVVNGITGVRDMGSDLDSVLQARADIAAHKVMGPRMVVSGPMLDGPKSHYKQMILVATPEDGRKAVDMLKARGVDFIKVQSNVPREPYFAIADEAKKDGVAFEGHVPDAIRASEAIDAGQQTFEHLIGVFEASSPDEDKYLTGDKGVGVFMKTYDPAREAKIIQMIAAHHVWQCPTLYWERGQWLVDSIDWTKDPDFAYAPKRWVKTWPAMQKGIVEEMDQDPLAVREAFVQHELDIVRKMHAAGVMFLAGTDSPAGVDVLPGISLHLELQRFVAAGFTPLEALQTATLNPAKFMGKTAEFGTVEVGKAADLVLLKENPLEDIRNTRTVVGVVEDGRYLSQAELEAMRAKLMAMAAAD